MEIIFLVYILKYGSSGQDCKWCSYEFILQLIGVFPYLVIQLLLGIKYLSLHCTAFDVWKPLWVFLDDFTSSLQFSW